MRRLVVSIFLLVLLSACTDGLATTSVTVMAPPTVDTEIVSSPVLTLTATTALLSPTISPAPTETETSIPCDPYLGYCLETGHFFLDRPISPRGMDRIDPAYPYGSTEGGTRDPHHGVEFYNGTGTPVLAAADGQVVFAGSDDKTMIGPRLDFYGNVVVLQHAFPGITQPVFTLYGHLSKIMVRVGQGVVSGDEIGEVGATGEAIGSHLHFEVRESHDDYSSNRNPVLWLKPLTGKNDQKLGVLAGRIMDSNGLNLYETNINIQYFQNDTQVQTRAYQVDSYAPESQPVLGDDIWNENFTLGDLPAGDYRVSLYFDGKFYDRRVVVQPGKLTFLIFAVVK